MTLSPNGKCHLHQSHASGHSDSKQKAFDAAFGKIVSANKASIDDDVNSRDYYVVTSKDGTPRGARPGTMNLASALDDEDTMISNDPVNESQSARDEVFRLYDEPRDAQAYAYPYRVFRVKNVGTQRRRGRFISSEEIEVVDELDRRELYGPDSDYIVAALDTAMEDLAEENINAVELEHSKLQFDITAKEDNDVTASTSALVESAVFEGIVKRDTAPKAKFFDEDHPDENLRGQVREVRWRGYNQAEMAIFALSARHTIGKEGGITQRAYDYHTYSWRIAIGRMHPDDAEPDNPYQYM